MVSRKFPDLTAQDMQRISLIIRVMTTMPGKKVRLEQIRANPDLSRYSNAQIYSCINQLVDDGWCDFSCMVPLIQLRNGYIYRLC